MTIIKKTDQIFNAITANGCREMDRERFHQAVNEAVDDIKKENQTLKNNCDTYRRMLAECAEAFKDGGYPIMADGINEILKRN